MKLLFDGCVPRPLWRFLPSHTVQTAPELGWEELRNGELLREAEPLFDAFVTADKNIRYQQNVTRRRIAILVLPTNRWPVLRTMTERIAAAVNRLQPGEFIEMAAD